MTPALIDATARSIADHADELTALDQAIDEALHKAGLTLAMKIGGASGPLYGSLLMGMAKAAKAGHGLPGQFAEGVAMVRKRGKSDVGAKTMLDVLVPVQATLEDRQDRSQAELITAIRRTANEAVEATRDMQATRGRASFLGERSKGHYDPGATSSRLLSNVICDILERQR